MGDKIMGVLNAIKNAEYGFDKIWGLIRDGYENVMNFAIYKGKTLNSVWEMAADAMNKIGTWLPYAILVILSVLLCFFGKKMMGFLKVVVFAGAGFSFGAAILPNLLGIATLQNYPWTLVIGVVLAVIAALLYKPLYIVGAVVLFGYSAYYLGYTYSVRLSFVNTADMRLIIAVVCAAVGILLFFLFRKFWERLVTAIGGGWLAMLAIKGIYDFTAVTALKNLGGFEQTFLRPDALVFVSELIVAGVIAIVGLIIQLSSKRRYY